MRLTVILPLALGAVVVASPPLPASGSTPATTGPRVPFRPRAWSPPAARTHAPGMTEGDSGAEAFALGLSRAQALSRVVVEVRADGSRHALLGGAIRAWSVASVDECGQVRLDCVSSEAAAKARVRVAGAPSGGK